MCINNLTAAFVYRIILITVTGLGLYLNLSFPSVKDKLSILAYYTIMSNFTVLIFFFIVVIFTAKSIRKGRSGCTDILLRPKGAVTMMITVTFLIYHFLLAPRLFSMGYNPMSAANLTVHYIVPVAVIIDWLLFDKKGIFKAYDPLLWLIIPVLYYIFILIRAALGFKFPTGGSYPYFFIDPSSVGYLGVFKWIILILIFFTALGYVFYLISFVAFKFLNHKNA